MLVMIYLGELDNKNEIKLIIEATSDKGKALINREFNSSKSLADIRLKEKISIMTEIIKNNLYSEIDNLTKINEVNYAKGEKF